MTYAGEPIGTEPEWLQYLTLEATDYISNLKEVWTWLQPKPKLPRIYPQQQLITTNHCQFSNRMRYQKRFQGHRFRLGGSKE